MGENIWNSALEYLEKSRRAWWNKDYMEFMIEKVWKITKPVSIIDFGCGLGFLGELLLPLLPKGSSYTGVDIGDKLLEEARKRFQNMGYETHFVEADLNEYETNHKYDIAICQTLLQHIPFPIKILEKMKDSVKQDGMVICIELSRDVAGASMYIDGVDYAGLNLLGIEQKLRRNDLDRTGKDFEIGMKLPVYMKRIGLRDIDVRVNDFVQLIDPSKEEYKEELDIFMTGMYTSMVLKNRQDFIGNLVKRGLTEQEAAQEFEGQLNIYNHLQEQKDNLHIVKSNCMFISYGYNRSGS